MSKALKDGAVATVNGEVREFEREAQPAQHLHVTHTARPVSAPLRRAAPPLVTVKIAPEVQGLLSAAQRVGRLSEEAVDLLGPVGIAAAIGLVAYGGYRWYKNQRPASPRRRQRKIKAALLPGGE